MSFLEGRRIGISKVEEVVQGNEKMDQVNSFIYLGSIISTDPGQSEDV